MSLKIRPATHAGSWYPDETGLLNTLHKLLARNDAVPGTRHLISPHAGYTYCGDTMSQGYSKVDFTNVKRCIIMGPSHHVYFKNKVQLSGFDALETPFGHFPVDVKLRDELVKGGCSSSSGSESESESWSRYFTVMDSDVDMDEHSLEMQFPMLWAAATLRGADPSKIAVLPILVSHNSSKVDAVVGKALARYLADESTMVILSSDFCHWGRRFGYTRVMKSEGPIYKSIEKMDHEAMGILEKSSNSKYSLWKKYIEDTGNTICGERPIGLFLCAMESVNKSTAFQWAHYSQSSKCTSPNDSSVSYAAGYF